MKSRLAPPPPLNGTMRRPGSAKRRGRQRLPSQKEGERKRRKKSAPFLPLRRFFIRQLLEVARKKRAKYPPLNAESTHRGFLTRKEGSNGGERERERWGGRRGGRRERDGEEVGRETDGLFIEQLHPGPRFAILKGATGRPVSAPVATSASWINLACTRCPRNKFPAILGIFVRTEIHRESNERNGGARVETSRINLSIGLMLVNEVLQLVIISDSNCDLVF